MRIPYYDCGETEPAEDGWLDVERIYCFDWDAFDRNDMDKLWAIFALLPHSKGHSDHECPRWYAESDDPENGYLTASVEPSGLQVFGTLPAGEWEAWDREFRQRAVGLPIRQLT